MLNKPNHAMCSNRNRQSKQGKIKSTLDTLFCNDRLSESGLTAIDFNFFINWNKDTISKEIWIKRILDDKIDISKLSKEDLSGALKSVDSPLYIKSLIELAYNYNLKLKYKIFQEKTNEEWNTCDLNNTHDVLSIEVNKDNGFINTEYQTINKLKKEIQDLSGGKVSMGYKGLTYGDSSLECYLSGTDAVWPGDADCIIMDAHKMQPLSLIEFKKHTLKNADIEDHTYDKYYKNKDFRKYKRLALLSLYLKVPLTVLYYSTHHENYILIDKLKVVINNNSLDLKLISREKKKVPSTPFEYNQFIDFLITDQKLL